MTVKRIGIAADHGGFELKEYLISALRKDGYEMVDFGNKQLKQDDDYPAGHKLPWRCCLIVG